MRADLQNTIAEIEKSLLLLGQRMDWDTAEHRLEEFNARVEDPDLWSDAAKAQKLMRERQVLVDAMATHKSIKQDLSDTVELIELGEMEGDEEGRPSKEHLDQQFARTVFMCNLTSTFIEHPDTKKFFGLLQYEPPCSKTVFGPLLDHQHRHVKDHVGRALRLNDPDNWLTVCVDGWSTIEKQPILNFVIVGRHGAFFLKKVDCTGFQKNHEKIAELIVEAVNEIGSEHVAAVVTDNEGKMTTAWEVIDEKFLMCM